MTHPLALVAAEALRQEFEGEMYYDRQWWPSINVKNHKWLPRDIPWDELRDEFDNVDVVKAWIEELYDHSEYDQLSAAEEIARESWWDDVTDEAREVFGSHVNVYGEGRQGGHLVVHGIGTPDEWIEEVCAVCGCDTECYDWDHPAMDVPDLERIRQWGEFREYVEAMKDDFAHMVGWHLCVNVHDRIHDLTGVI
jgi:hypothetical protein